MTSLVKECMMDKFVIFVSKKPRLDNAGNANDDKIYLCASIETEVHFTKARKYLHIEIWHAVSVIN
jgi:hypothetical protein